MSLSEKILLYEFTPHPKKYGRSKRLDRLKQQPPMRSHPTDNKCRGIPSLKPKKGDGNERIKGKERYETETIFERDHVSFSGDSSSAIKKISVSDL